MQLLPKDGVALPSLKHEGLLEIFRNRPELVVRFLREWKVALPASTKVRLCDSDLTVSLPKALKDDLAVELGEGRKKLTVAVEVQLYRRARKKRVWAL